MARDLVIIEAAGKLRSTYRSFEALGYGAEIVATLGHLYDYPRHLDVPAIAFDGSHFIETERRAARPDTYKFLSERLSACDGRVLVATDDDQEGHVIADDAVQLVRAVNPHVTILRVLPHALSPMGWREALDRASPYDSAAAAPGIARRIADRLIASAFSDASRGHVVGRIQSALVGIAEQGALATTAVRLSCAAADGGVAFTTIASLTPEALAVATSPLEPATTASSWVSGKSPAMNAGDALLALHEELRLSLNDAAALLQAMYEDGEISYPRSPARGFRATGRDAVAMLARSRGIRGFNAGSLPTLPDHADGAHEALHLTDADFAQRLDLGKPLGLSRDVRYAAGVLIARRSIESGVPVAQERASPDSFPEWARDLPWTRTARSPVLPWQEARPGATRPIDASGAALRAQLAYGLGKASTWARHGERFAAAGWLNTDHRLNLRGRLHAQALPVALRDPKTSSAIERTLDDPSLDVTERVMGALKLALAGDGGAMRDFLESIHTHEDAPYAAPAFAL